MTSPRILFTIALAGLAACQPHVPAYTVGAAPQRALVAAQHAGAAPVRDVTLALVGDAESERSRISCRALGIDPPEGGAGFDVYLRDAIARELQTARMAATNGPRSLDVRVSQLEQSSFGDAGWTITATFRLGGRHPIETTVTAREPFESALSADSACQNAADALPKALHQLFARALATPAFWDALLGHEDRDADP